MVGHAQFEYAPPKSWDQFEEMCADLFQTMWNDASLVRHGRAGQSQNGVDIVARHGALYPVGIQCKRRAKWPVSKVTAAQIADEIKDAEAFKPPLKHFYIVTTAQDDTKLQEHLRTLNEARRTANKFEVTLLGWSELVRRITLEPTVAHKHFGAVGGAQPEPLLATWFIKAGLLNFTDREFELATEELALDLEDHPNGRVVIRQFESEELLLQIQALEASERTDQVRQQWIDMRKQLRVMAAREAQAVRSLKFLFQTPGLKDSLRYSWEKQMPMLVRGVVEGMFGPIGITAPNDFSEMRLWPPGKPHRDVLRRITVYLSAEQVDDVLEARRRHLAKWKNPMADAVGELPESALHDAFPAIVRRLLRNIDDGESIEELRAAGWLDPASWAFCL
ncbi:restriction endonuclease [Variovorax paradoxus]|uniref:restriction endonuclease n=1 Tax=Variovorax paradoxus TaxID=34073 RepID=UPI003F51893E